MKDNNILTPNINIEKKEPEKEKIEENKNIPNEEKIKIPDWDLTPPFETIDRSVL